MDNPGAMQPSIAIDGDDLSMLVTSTQTSEPTLLCIDRSSGRVVSASQQVDATVLQQLRETTNTVVAGTGARSRLVCAGGRDCRILPHAEFTLGEGRKLILAEVAAAETVTMPAAMTPLDKPPTAPSVITLPAHSLPAVRLPDTYSPVDLPAVAASVAAGVVASHATAGGISSSAAAAGSLASSARSPTYSGSSVGGAPFRSRGSGIPDLAGRRQRQKGEGGPSSPAAAAAVDPGSSFRKRAGEACRSGQAPPRSQQSTAPTAITAELSASYPPPPDSLAFATPYHPISPQHPRPPTHLVPDSPMQHSPLPPPQSAPTTPLHLQAPLPGAFEAGCSLPLGTHSALNLASRAAMPGAVCFASSEALPGAALPGAALPGATLSEAALSGAALPVTLGLALPSNGAPVPFAPPSYAVPVVGAALGPHAFPPHIHPGQIPSLLMPMYHPTGQAIPSHHLPSQPPSHLATYSASHPAALGVGAAALPQRGIASTASAGGYAAGATPPELTATAAGRSLACGGTPSQGAAMGTMAAAMASPPSPLQATLPPAPLAPPATPANGIAPSVVWDAYTTGRTAYYMEAGDPNPILLAQPDGPPGAPILTAQTTTAQTILASSPPPSLAPSDVALGLVSMTKKPLDMPTWLEYHRRVVGIRRFYIKVEDTPELAALFASAPWDRLVVATFDDCTQRDYFAQMDRQSEHLASTLPRARADGLTHLLHVDDDELLCCPRGVGGLLTVLAAAPASRPDCHLCNIEALVPHEACASPFREATVFRHLPTRYVSYTNGKSIGRLDDPTLRAHGPHHFRNHRAAGGAQSPVTFPIGPEVACILHYESATFAKWHQKFLELARRHGTDPEVYARVPFTFYRSSMAAATAILHARANQDVAAEAEANAIAYALWCEHKLAPPGLPPPTARPRVLSNGITVLNPFLVALTPAAAPG